MSRPRLIALLLALLTLVVYLPVRNNEFVTYDDNDYLTENLVVQSGLTWAGVKWAFTTWHASNWHPLTWLSHMLDCELFGLDAGAHHLVNALLHAVNSVLLFGLLRRWTRQLWPAALVAALFAWHPLRVESVAWAAERKDVLSAGFGLLTMLAYTGYAERRQAKLPSAWPHYGLALLCFALGLLAKPMLVTVPFVLLLLDWWPLQRMTGASGLTAPRLIFEKVPFLLLSLVSCVITFLAQRATAVLTVDQYALPMRLGNALLSYGQYLWKTIWPAPLAIPYPLPTNLAPAPVALAVGILALFTWLALRTRRVAPFLLLGWLWFLGTLVPVIGLVQVGRQALADRYTYLPHVGLFIAVVYGLETLAKRWRMPGAVCLSLVGLVLGACLLLTERQLLFWRNSESLFTHSLAVTQNNPIAQINLGLALAQLGRHDAALIHYREALRLEPRYVQAHNNLALLLDTMNRDSQALAEYEVALQLQPNAARVRCNYGTLLVKLGRCAEALDQYEHAARLAPADALPRYLMGKAELRQGHSEIAVAHFRAALMLNPKDLRTLTFLARVLASDASARIRNGVEAVSLAERANARAGGADLFVLDTVAMAYAESGNFETALATMESAIQVARVAGEELPAEMRQRQRLYQARQPFRETPAESSGRVQGRPQP